MDFGLVLFDDVSSRCESIRRFFGGDASCVENGRRRLAECGRGVVEADVSGVGICICLYFLKSLCKRNSNRLNLS